MMEFELHLLNDFQHDFPLVPAPFSAIAGRMGASEARVLAMLAQLQARGMVSRVGAVFRPHSIGSSALAAMALPADKLDEVAGLVSAYAEVNHNYEREHHFNLWFVVVADDEANLRAVLGEIESRSGYPVLHLPMLENYHIDLGFDLLQSRQGGRRDEHRSAATPRAAARGMLTQTAETALIRAIQQGFPLVPRPFAVIGEEIGLTEGEVIAGLADLVGQGVIKRMGVVVRHHELGYRANAMVVWDIPDAQVAALGRCIGQFDFVTLCYRRPRRLPGWRYNLFSMIHGCDRDAVLALVEDMRQRCDLLAFPHEVLFSCRRFKQRGAHYVAAAAGVTA